MNGRARPRRPRLCHPNHPTCKGVALPRANGKARSEGGLGWPAQRVAPLFIHQATDARHLLKQVALPHANGRARSKGGLGWPAQRVAPLFIHQTTIALHLQSIEESDDQRWTRQKQQSTRYKGTRPGWDRTGKKGFDLPHFDRGRLQTTLGNTTTTARHTRELSLGLGTERANVGLDLPHFGGGAASDDAGEHNNNNTTYKVALARGGDIAGKKGVGVGLQTTLGNTTTTTRQLWESDRGHKGDKEKTRGRRSQLPLPDQAPTSSSSSAPRSSRAGSDDAAAITAWRKSQATTMDVVCDEFDATKITTCRRSRTARYQRWKIHGAQHRLVKHRQGSRVRAPADACNEAKGGKGRTQGPDADQSTTPHTDGPPPNERTPQTWHIQAFVRGSQA